MWICHRTIFTRGTDIFESFWKKFEKDFANPSFAALRGRELIFSVSAGCQLVPPRNRRIGKPFQKLFKSGAHQFIIALHCIGCVIGCGSAAGMGHLREI
jgi:hypothetical protein